MQISGIRICVQYLNLFGNTIVSIYMVQTMQQFFSMHGTVNIFNLVMTWVEPFVHILMTGFYELVWSLTQWQLCLHDVFWDMSGHYMNFVNDSKFELLMQNQKISFKLFDYLDGLQFELFSTTSLLKFSEAFKGCLKVQEFLR